MTAYSARDSELRCTDIGQEWREADRERRNAEANIAYNRAHNQAMGYFGGLFFPPLLLMAEHNEADKERLVELQRRRDVLIELSRAKNCPSLH